MSKASIEIGGIRIGAQTNDAASLVDQPELEIKSQTRIQTKTSSDLPFHALILGNFSGSRNHTNSLKPKAIDRDNFDDILQSISPTLNLCPTNDQAHTITLKFKELEDFEPDHLFESLDIFSDLRTLRRRLANNATFEAAAKEMTEWKTISAKNATEVETPEPAFDMETEGSVLDSLLTETKHRQEESTAHAGENLAQSLIQQVVAPYIIPGTHPQKAEMLSVLDDSISGLMKTLLHHPEFQALEASWRSLYSTVRKIRTDTKLKLFYVDIDKQSLINITDGEKFNSSKAYKNLIEPYTDIAGCNPWSVIVGDYYFGDDANDILLLESMGLLAKQSDATFVAAAKSELVDCKAPGDTPDVDDWNLSRDDKYVEAWNFLRNLPQSANLALTFPRVISRLPYGNRTTAIESFSFEEMSGSEHDHYLWANGAYVILRLLAESYENHGWDFTPGIYNEINNLPAHSYEEDGDTELKPCAEIYLTEKGGERIVENGLLPIWSILRSDSVRIGPFVSLHHSHQRISGKWQS